jgi:ABC-2 type transport system permease protein
MRIGGSWRRVRTLLRKELRQIFRDPKTRRVIFASPIIQLLLFGYAVTTDVHSVKTFVVDHDATAESRALQDALTASGYFRVVGRSTQPRQLAGALDAGRAVVGLEIPPGFAADLAAGRGASVQILVDGTHSNPGTVAQGYAARIVQEFGLAYAARSGAAGAATAAGMDIAGTGGATAGVELRARAWYNPDLASRVYNIPAVIGVLLLFISLLLTALTVVRERELGTLEQLAVTPLTPGELMLGKALPVALIAFLDLILIAVVGILWFQIPFRGSLPVLLLAAAIYTLVGIGIGLIISTSSRTQQEAFMGVFLLFLPATVLAGFMYPVRSMPLFFQKLTILNPARHFLELVRAVFLKGSGIGELWPQLLILAAMAVLVMVAAVRRFSRTMG